MSQAFEQLSAALAGRYHLERELGEGGMATVYLASDVRHERKVAVKVLRHDLSASIGSERFLQEIRIAARLSHPHILPLHDSGEANGLLYYVMPFVSGESLRQRIAREGELPVADAARILRDVTDALAYAHELGVVHRDIKPENILLTGRHALVADFGVAKAVSEATGRNKLTTAGVALGTPAYMAPEQAVADPHVDHRADIYAIGVVGYEMIAGSPPFTGGSPQQVLASQVTELPRPVTTRRPAMPPLLATAIMRCLEKKPADRWQSAGDLLTQLEAAQTTTGGSTPTDTRPIAAVSWRGRRRPALIAGAAVLAALVAAGLWLSTAPSSANEGPAVTLRDRTQLTFTGRIKSPAISPDAKQLAYVTQECSESGCTYSVDVQDVGGTASRRVLAGAASAYFLEWSPDRRNLLVTGTINGSWGTHLVSLLGGAPRRVGLGGMMGGSGVAFYAGGDSLLVTPRVSVDTLQWIGVSALHGPARDSIPVRTGGARIGGIVAIPGSSWIEVDLLRSNTAERIILDRTGREAARQEVRAGSNRASTDALWVSFSAGGGDQSILVRTPFDASTGRIGARADTMYTGRFTGFSVSADGAALALDDGTYQHNVYALELEDALAGRFPDQRRLMQASTFLRGDISPDGRQVVIGRAIPGAQGAIDYRWSLLPFQGGAESALPVPPGTRSVMWFDSTTVAAHRRDGSASKFALVDARTGAVSHEFTPDSVWWDWTPLPAGGWAWIPDGTGIRVHQNGQTRFFPKPAWHEMLTGLSASSTGRLLFRGWSASTSDTMGVAELSTTDGTVTPWFSRFVDDGRINSLADGTALFHAYDTAESVTLIRLDGPGTSRRLGTIPRPIRTLSVSEDLKRAVIVTRDYFGDVWLMRVAPVGSR